MQSVPVNHHTPNAQRPSTPAPAALFCLQLVKRRGLWVAHSVRRFKLAPPGGQARFSDIHTARTYLEGGQLYVEYGSHGGMTVYGTPVIPWVARHPLDIKAVQQVGAGEGLGGRGGAYGGRPRRGGGEAHAASGSTWWMAKRVMHGGVGESAVGVRHGRTSDTRPTVV